MNARTQIDTGDLRRMLKKLCSVLLSALLLQAAAIPAFAATAAEKEAKRAEKVRTQLAKLGTGTDARVKLELRDKTKLEGYISELGAESFELRLVAQLKLDACVGAGAEFGELDRKSTRLNSSHM